MTKANVWETEGDFEEWTHGRARCVIRRNHIIGNLCGYIGVPDGHPLYGVRTGEDEFPHSVNPPHGGWTYSSHEQDPVTYYPDSLWWFGFDCAHAYDYLPVHADHGIPPRRDGTTYKTLEYVRSELIALAERFDKIDRKHGKITSKVET